MITAEMLELGNRQDAVEAFQQWQNESLPRDEMRLYKAQMLPRVLFMGL